MSEPIKVRKQPQANCKDCSLSGLCLPLSLNMQDMESLDEIVKRGQCHGCRRGADHRFPPAERAGWTVRHGHRNLPGIRTSP